MAQRLKDIKREAIISATKKLMLENGIDSTDMRSIAKEANITVGNLYRYFEDKQALINTITSPLIMELELILKNNTFGEFSLSNKSMLKVIDNKIGNIVVDRVISKILNDFYLVGVNDKDTMIILLNDVYFKDVINQWLSDILIDNKDKLKTVMIKIHISAMVNSLNTLLKEGIFLTNEEYLKISKYYVNSLNKTLMEIMGDKYV